MTATGRGLHRWTDRQVWQAQAASCGPEQRARGAEGAWLTTTDGHAGTSKAGQADGLANGPNRGAILAQIPRHKIQSSYIDYPRDEGVSRLRR